MSICGHTTVIGNTIWICTLPPHDHDDDEDEINQRGSWVANAPSSACHRYVNANRVDTTPGPD